MSQAAILIAYIPIGMHDTEPLQYTTTNFEEVVKFKKLCTTYDISFAVRFTNKTPTSNDYIVKPKQAVAKTVKSIFSFLNKKW